MAPIAQKTDIYSPLRSDHPAPMCEDGGICGIYATKVDAGIFKWTFQRVAAQTDDRTITPNDFHRDMFDQQVMKADMRAVFTEYAWDMNWCDPCAADPLSHEELRSLGVFWLTEAPPELVPGRGPRPIMPPMGGGRDVCVTRMQVRAEAQEFSENLVLSEAAGPAGWEIPDSRQ